jgi:hypothetical protein
MGSATYLTKTNEGFIAGAAISKGMIFMLDETNNYPYVLKCTANTDVPLGVATADAASGEEVQCILWPGEGEVVTMIDQGGLAEGALVMPSNGTAGSVETAGTSGRVIGKAVEASTTTQYCRIKMFGGYISA